MLDRLKKINEELMDYVQPCIESNAMHVCCNELGAMIDMIKDISESIYYYEKLEEMRADEASAVTATTTSK